MECFMVNGGQDAVKIALIISEKGSVKGWGVWCVCVCVCVCICDSVWDCVSLCGGVHACVHDNTVNMKKLIFSIQADKDAHFHTNEHSQLICTLLLKSTSCAVNLLLFNVKFLLLELLLLLLLMLLLLLLPLLLLLLLLLLLFLAIYSYFCNL